MPIYVKLPGGIVGPVTEKNHKQWIAIDSCDLNVERPVIEGTAAAKNREWGAPKVSAFNFSMKVEDSTGLVAKWSCGQPVLGTGETEIHFLRTGPDGYLAYTRMKLSACILSTFNFSTSNSMEEKGTIEFKLSFLGIHWEFEQFNEAGESEVVTKADYNQRTAVAEYA